VYQRLQQPNWKIIDAIEAFIFEGVERGALARTGTSADDDEFHIAVVLLVLALSATGGHGFEQGQVISGCPQCLAIVSHNQYFCQLRENLQVFV